MLLYLERDILEDFNFNLFNLEVSLLKYKKSHPLLYIILWWNLQYLC